MLKKVKACLVRITNKGSDLRRRTGPIVGPVKPQPSDLGPPSREIPLSPTSLIFNLPHGKGRGPPSHAPTPPHAPTASPRLLTAGRPHHRSPPSPMPPSCVSHLRGCSSVRPWLHSWVQACSSGGDGRISGGAGRSTCRCARAVPRRVPTRGSCWFQQKTTPVVAKKFIASSKKAYRCSPPSSL